GKYLPLTATPVRLSASAMNCSIYGLGLVASGISLVMIISAAPAAPPQQIARAAHQGAALLQIVFMSPPSRRLIRLFACRAPDGAHAMSSCAGTACPAPAPCPRPRAGPPAACPAAGRRRRRPPAGSAPAGPGS